MLDIIKKLLFSRQISFEKGKIFLLGAPVVMQPSSIFTQLKKEVVGRGTDKDLLYIAAKNAGKEYMKIISKKFSMSLTEGIKWGINSFELGGWGITHIENLKSKESKAIIHIRESTIAREYGSSKEPVDDIMAGFIAGASCIYWGKDMDVKETKCIAKGDPLCEFIVMPAKEFKGRRNST